MARRALTLTFAVLVLAAACHGQHTHTPPSERSGPPTVPELDAAPAPTHAGASAPPARAPYKPSSSLGEALGIRAATRARTVYAEPNPDARERGRILRGESFHVYAEQRGPGCDRAWGQVADAAWICLERTESSTTIPRVLPVLEPGMSVPFIYARHPDHDDPATPPIPVYRSLSDYRSGAAAKLELPAFGSYAFTRLRHNHGDPLLITNDRNVVRASDLELFEPSEFSGRDLLELPLPAAETLAWGVRWKTAIHVAPDPTAEISGRIKFHTAMFVIGEGVIGPDDQRWFEVVADDSHATGWVAADDIRRFIPVAPPAPTLGGQVTLDIDLDQQVLSVWIEDRPVFVTLISSGKPNDQTPTGLFRVETKRAYGKMQSLPHAREPYFVEAVPWTMYFQGRYALHASYWHDMFGHRMSHGCVNLSPQDAKRVFELASPQLPDGWLLVHEHAADPGAVVRIRKQGDTLTDHRQPLDGSVPGPSGASTD